MIFASVIKLFSFWAFRMSKVLGSGHICRWSYQHPLMEASKPAIINVPCSMLRQAQPHCCFPVSGTTLHLYFISWDYYFTFIIAFYYDHYHSRLTFQPASRLTGRILGGPLIGHILDTGWLAGQATIIVDKKEIWPVFSPSLCPTNHWYPLACIFKWKLVWGGR